MMDHGWISLNQCVAKDQFYDDLSVAVNHTSRHDVTIVMGNLNASVGSDRITNRGIIVPVCSNSGNDNGSRVLDFCESKCYPKSP